MTSSTPSKKGHDMVNCPYCGEPEYIFGFEPISEADNVYNEAGFDFYIIQECQCANCNHHYQVKSKFKLISHEAMMMPNEEGDEE